MGAGHGHGHSQADGHAASRAVDRQRLWLVLGIAVTVMLIELVGAWWSGSLALLADAGHMLTDAAGVLLALGASYVATRPAGPKQTFGGHRAEVMAALVNAMVLLALCVFVVVGAVQRLMDPPEVEAPQMVAFAVVGLLANLGALVILRDRAAASLNMRGAFLEVLGDAVGSVAAVVAGIVIWTTGLLRADPIASLAIAVLIVPRAISLLRDASRVLMEHPPRGLDVQEIRAHLADMDGVLDVHDLHVWTITSGLPSLSAHVTVTDEHLQQAGVGRVLDALSTCVREDFQIAHATFQVEPRSHRAHEDLGELEHD